ncbi:mediator complex subunit [Mycoblastus sanguinarius]|nr:mediator complex subunit [Mycoblastus sanguinarius]
MPGILPRSESATKVSGTSKIPNDTQSGATAGGDTTDVKLEDYRNGDRHMNGGLELVNGTYANGISATPTGVQRKTSTAMEKLVGQLPPELEHVTYGYVRFSALVAKLAQSTFNGLEDVIKDMSELPVSQPGQNALLSHPHHQVNGIRDSSQTNVQKKLRMLSFASNRRAQFIKILILSRWARQAEAVGRVVDLNVWLNTQKRQYNECCSWMGELKRLLVPVKDPNPDIKTALEVLSLGKASWLPNVDYLAPETFSSGQLLDAFRRINTLLSIRLNLHEAIPLALRDFSIASGRATFRVLDEFEVDLSIAEEEPSSQLYFIDFRFTFSPMPAELPAGRLRSDVEGRANDVLKREGLQGLFDFLHNLALTHKLNVFRNQAFEMTRGNWSEDLQVEAVHRSVVVQYWSNRPGGKNWIELGLKRGQETRKSHFPSAQRVPYIALRWFRSGKEVTGFQINMRLGDLSLANILKQVIALHTNYIFQEIAAMLRGALLYSEGSLRLKSSFSATESMDASLLIQVTASKAVKVIQEPISGRFALLPASHLNSRAESELNRLLSPATEGASRIADLRSVTSQEEAGASARSVGWESVRSLNPGQETMQRLFPKATQRTNFFRRQSWSLSWILAFTTSPKGDFWWVVELLDKETAPEPPTSNAAAGPKLRAAYKVATTEPPQSLVLEHSYTALAQLERNAAGMISQYIDTRHLAASRIPHKIQLSAAHGAENRSATIFLRFPFIRTPSILQSSNSLSLPWANEIVRLDYRGLDPSNSSVVHIASARMQNLVSNIKDLTSAISSIAFHPTSGAFAFQLLTKVGETTITNLVHRLSAIGRLLDFICTIKTHGLTFNSASLTHVDFTYNNILKPLKAVIHFPSNAPMRISLTKPNPHLRIVDHLTARLLSHDLATVIALMRMTLPLLRALSSIESDHTGGGVEVLTRSEQWYRVRYFSPYPKGGYDIRLRQRRDEPMWHIPESTVKKGDEGDEGDEAFDETLKAVTNGKGEGWIGMNGGVVATIKGVEETVGRLDEVFRKRRHVAEESNPRKRKAEGEVVEID